MAKESAAASNQTAEKLLLVLEALARQTQPVKLVDLAHEVGMNPSTCYRFVAALQNAGYAAQDRESGKYILNLKLCSLAEMIKDRVSVTNLLHAFVAEASALFQESAHLVQEENQQIVYIDNVTVSSQSLITRQYIGRTAPMYCTGVGKLFLLEYGQEELEAYIARTGLPRLTQYTHSTRAALGKALAFSRERGYALDNEECEIGVRCVAAPVRDYTGRIVAGLSVSGPTSRVTDALIDEKLPAFLDIAARASREMGYAAPQGPVIG